MMHGIVCIYYFYPKMSRQILHIITHYSRDLWKQDIKNPWHIICDVFCWVNFKFLQEWFPRGHGPNCWQGKGIVMKKKRVEQIIKTHATSRDYCDFLREPFLGPYTLLDMGVINLDGNGTIIEANKAAEEMFNAPPGQLLGYKFSSFYYNPKNAPAIPQENQSFEIKLQNQRGFFWAKITTGELSSQPSDTMGIQLIIKDITARKLTEKELGWKFRISTELESIMELLSRKDCDMGWVTRRILMSAVNLTQSQNGFIAHLTPDAAASSGMTLVDIHPNLRPLQTRVIKLNTDKNHTYQGLLGQSLNTLRPFFLNPQPGPPPLLKLPKNHIPISGFLSIPIIMDADPVGMLLLANPKTAYGQEHVKVAQKLITLYLIAQRRQQSASEISRLTQLWNRERRKSI